MTESIEEVERFPTDGEVTRKIEAYLGERQYNEVRKLEDEKGMYFLELTSVDKDGDLMFVYYKRVGNYGKNMLSTETVIEVTYTFAGEEMGGDTVARWEGGEWKEA
jgi:hypothetical protein